MTDRFASGAPHVVVVGGGISGLTAAHAVASARPDVSVSVLESSGSVGGKLRLGEVAGVTVDLGAESLLNRRPEATRLARAVGLADDLVHPATTAAALWTRGALRALPSGHVMGVPADLRALGASGVLSAAGLARVPLDALLPGRPLEEDVAIGHIVAARMGSEVVDRLVEPLLGGVYAGHARELSLEATVPALFAEATATRSLLEAARRVRAAAPPSDVPVFAGVRGGVGRLPAAVAAASGAAIRTGVTVRAVDQVERGFRLTVGPTAAAEVIAADAVVLAVPAVAAARLVASVAPAVGADLAAIEYASSALVTWAFPARGRVADLQSSGLLVPPVDRHYVKASTFSSRKWSWVGDAAPDLVVVRASVGRHRGEADLQVDDDELAARALSDLAAAVGPLPDPVDTVVTRWGGGLPQYVVGHRDRVGRIRRGIDLVPGVEVCGAYLDGVGVAACVASAEAAAARVVAGLPGAGG